MVLRIDANRTARPLLAGPRWLPRPGAKLRPPAGRAVAGRAAKAGMPGGGAPEARLLYEDLDPPQPKPKATEEPAVPTREDGAGRPTKRERRAIDRLRGD